VLEGDPHAQRNPLPPARLMDPLMPSPFATRPPVHGRENRGTTFCAGYSLTLHSCTPVQVLRFVFFGDNEALAPLPPHFREGLKWKMQSTTPNLVKKMIARSGFEVTTKACARLGGPGRGGARNRFPLVALLWGFPDMHCLSEAPHPGGGNCRATGLARGAST
jgi:hypothetical protein